MSRLLTGVVLGGLGAGVLWLWSHQPAAELQVLSSPVGNPKRVVSVNITSDEVLLALAPERLLAVSYLAADPDISSVVREAEKIPVKLKADVERIVALAPDLVVMGAHNTDVARQIEDLGIAVVRVQGFESIEWVRRLITTLGRAIGEPLRAQQLTADMDERLKTVAGWVASRRRPTVLYYSSGGFTPGKGTIFDELVHMAGGDNLAARLGVIGWQRLSLEQAVMANPEVILTSDKKWWTSEFSTDFETDPAFRGVRAIRSGRVYQLPRRLMTTSSHYVAETVEALARLLHPDAFVSPST